MRDPVLTAVRWASAHNYDVALRFGGAKATTTLPRGVLAEASA